MLSLPTTATEGGLALGFVRQGEHLDRVALTPLTETPSPPMTGQARWTMLAQADNGDRLWRWSVPAPRLFDLGGGGRSAFTLLIPDITAGTRLTLLDQNDRPQWSELFDEADLIEALDHRQTLITRVYQARAPTASLARAQVGDALERQLAAVETVRAEATLSGKVAVSAIVPAPSEAAAETPLLPMPGERSTPRSSLSIDLDSARTARVDAASANSVPVLVSVVDELGNPPGVAFPAKLFRDNSYLGQFQFDSQGQATLPLEVGGDYSLDLLPIAPLVARRHTFSYSGAAVPPVVLEIGWQLDLQLLDSTGNALMGGQAAIMFGYTSAMWGQFPLTPLAQPGLLRFAVPKDPNWNYSIDVTPANASYARFSYTVGRLSGNRNASLNLVEISPIAGQARAADAGPLPSGGSVNCVVWSSGGVAYQNDSTIGADGSFEIRLPVNAPAFCSFILPAPMLIRTLTRTFHPGETLDVTLLRGIPVRFVVQEQNGQAVVVGFDGRWDDAPTQSSASCYGNPCELLLPNDRAVEMKFRFDEMTFAPIRLEPVQYAANSEHVVIAQALRRVSGRVLNAAANTSHSIRVRVYDAANNFIISSLGAEFEFKLRAGAYRFEADQNTPYPLSDAAWAFRQTVSSAQVQVDADVVLPDLVLSNARGEVQLVVDRPCGFDDLAVRIGLTTPDGRRIESMKRQLDSVASPSRPPGQCASVHTLGLSPGHYLIDAAPLGWLPQRIDTTIVAGQAQTLALAFTAANRNQIWRGQLLDAQQRPPLQAMLRVLDGDQSQSPYITVADAQGRFEIPFVPGWGVDVLLFNANAERTVRNELRYGSTPPPSLWPLDQIELTLLPEAGLRRLYGDGDRQRRLNILFVAEGYTDVAESFSDLNGNGVWDGVVWYDLNGSGVFESQYDRVAIYGHGIPYPTEGSVPTANNEPFTDLNNDGILSLNDPALFVENTRAFMRSLLGSDVWSTHRDAFNAWLMFAPSIQAGHDVLDINDNLLVQRDTRYRGALSLNGWILQVDSTTVTSEALIALPEVDLVVVMVNEPISGGRANASTGAPGFMIVPGGVLQNDINAVVQSHEMGHFVGALCDEYSINLGFHPGIYDPSADLGCANATLEVSPTKVPWRDLFTNPTGSLPTLDINGSTGLFEGASYVFNGAYRPSLDSTMRNTKPFFNAPSRQALEDALAAHAVAAETIFRSGFE